MISRIMCMLKLLTFSFTQPIVSKPTKMTNFKILTKNKISRHYTIEIQLNKELTNF